MKVLHVVGPLEVGGAQTQLLGIVRAAVELGLWEPHVCSTAPGAMLPEFRRSGVPLLELRRWGSPGLLRVRAIRRHLRQHPVDVVHAMLPAPNAYARLAVAGRRDRPAVVVGERDVEPRSRARVAVERALRPWTESYVANSEAVAEMVRRVHGVGAGRLVEIPNAVDREIFFPGSSLPGRARVGALGRLSSEKGMDLLVGAGAALSQVPGIEVVIAGDGPERPSLERSAAGGPVRLAGPLAPGRAVAEFLRSLDVFVLPSRREGRPNALLEAQACGVPAVATDIAGVRETAVSSTVLVPVDDAAAMAAAIRRLLDDPSAGERARSAAFEVPTFEDVARGHQQVFEEAVAGRRLSC